MKPPYPADIQGESELFRYTLTRTIQSSVEISGLYSFDCERYSAYDYKLIDRNYIFIDHNNKPFNSLKQVLIFVDEDCIAYWRNKVLFSNDGKEYSTSTRKLIAWEELRVKLLPFVKKEPIPFKFNPN